MWRKLAFLSVLILSGCIHNAPIPQIPRPDVIIAGDGDPVPDELVTHIIKRTNGFCVEEGKKGVRRIVIKHNAKKKDTQVVYACINDCLDYDDPPTCKEGSDRHAKEFMSSGEIDYMTFVALLRRLP